MVLAIELNGRDDLSEEEYICARAAVPFHLRISAGIDDGHWVVTRAEMEKLMTTVPLESGQHNSGNSGSCVLPQSVRGSDPPPNLIQMRTTILSMHFFNKEKLPTTVCSPVQNHQMMTDLFVEFLLMQGRGAHLCGG